MADPLSLVSAIVGLTAVGTKIFNQLYQFIDSFRSAPSNIVSLARELEELCSILTRLESTLNNGVRHEVLWLGLRDVLESCVKRFSQLEALVKVYGIRPGDRKIYWQWKKWRWTFQEKEVAGLRVQLEAHKATLNITLLLSTHTETASVKDTADRIESAVQAVLQRLGEMQEGKNSIASYASSIGRYLHNNASSFVSLALVDHPEEYADPDLAAGLLPGGQGQPELLEGMCQLLEEQIQPFWRADRVPDEIQISEEAVQHPIEEVTQIQTRESQSPQEDYQRMWVAQREETPLREKSQLPGDIPRVSEEVTQPPEEEERVGEILANEGEEEHNQLTDEKCQSSKIKDIQCSEEEEHSQLISKECQLPKNEWGKVQTLEKVTHTVSVVVLCTSDSNNDNGGGEGARLVPTCIDDDNQPQMQLVELPADDNQLQAEEIQLLEGFVDIVKHSQLLIEKVMCLSHEENGQAQPHDEGFQSRVDEIVENSGVRYQQFQKESESLREREVKMQLDIGKKEHEGDKWEIDEKKEEKEVGVMVDIWGPDQNYPSDSTIICVEGQSDDQLRKSMQVQTGLQRSYEQATNIIKEGGAAKLNGARIEEVEWERVQQQLVEKWERGREAAERKGAAKKRKSNTKKTVTQREPQNIYTINCKAGEREIRMMLPNAYNCREASNEQEIEYIEWSKYFVIREILTQMGQEYLWARTKQMRRKRSTSCREVREGLKTDTQTTADHTKQIKDTIHQVSTIQGHAEEYFKYIHITGQTRPIIFLISVEMMPGGGMGPKVNSIKWNNLSPLRSFMHTGGSLWKFMPEWLV